MRSTVSVAQAEAYPMRSRTQAMVRRDPAMASRWQMDGSDVGLATNATTLAVYDGMGERWRFLIHPTSPGSAPPALFSA